MKRRLLSLLAVVGLLLALTVPFATPVMAAAPTLNAINFVTGGIVNNLPTSVRQAVSNLNNGAADQTYLVDINGTNLTNVTDVRFYTWASGAQVAVYTNPLDVHMVAGSIVPDTAFHFQATISVPATAVHRPLDVTVFSPIDGESALLYGAFIMGDFPHPHTGATGSSLTLSLVPYYDQNGVTPIISAVVPGQQIWYKAELSQPLTSKYNYNGGQLSVRFPSWLTDGNVNHKVAGYGAATPGFYSVFPSARDIPEISPASGTFSAMCIDPYIANAADLDGSGFLNAYADYGNVTENPTQIPGVVEGNSPLPLAGSIPNALQMEGSLTVTKSLVIPNGVLLSALDGSFTVNVTGPSHLSPGINHTFHMVDGVIVNDPSPNESPWILTHLIPGIYHVSETPPSPWNVAITGSSGNVSVISDGTATSIVTNTYVPGSLQITKATVIPNGVTGPTGDFTVNVSGPSYPSSGGGINHTFHMVNGSIVNDPPPNENPWILNNLIPGAYVVTEVDPSASWSHTITPAPGSNVTVSTGTTASRVVTNTYSVPHTQVQTLTASPSQVTPDGGLVTITVTDLNDGTVDITSPGFILSSVPPITVLPNVLPASMLKVSEDGLQDGIMNPGEIWTFSLQVFVSEETIFTATGHGFAGAVDISGPSETRTVVVTIPHVPASSNLSLGLLIVGFAGIITFFGWQRRKRSQPSR